MLLGAAFFSLIISGYQLENLVGNFNYTSYSSLQNENKIIGNFKNLNDCFESCDSKKTCLGIGEVIKNSTISCYTLSNLGDLISTPTETYSYRKTTHFQKEYGNYTIHGEVDYASESTDKETFVYIDSNLNGVYDKNEIGVQTSNHSFVFSELPEGRYLLRELTHDGCNQLFPGVNGYGINLWGNGYVDSIAQYYYDGHPEHPTFVGGNINTPNKLITKNSKMNWLTGYNPTKYIRFYKNYNITLAFVDETVIDGPGNDIKVSVFRGDGSAHVSVSDNGLNFKRIGILDENNTEFDLNGYDKHVGFVNIHMIDGYLDIIGVEGNFTSLYSPSYGYYITLPYKTDHVDITFFNDCHYFYDCYTHCFLMKTTFDSSDGCMVGCDLYDFHRNCECINYEQYDVPFFGKNYHSQDCYEGCYYEVNHNNYPDYILLPNQEGYKKSLLNTNNCDENITCYDSMIRNCISDDTCASVSLGESSTYYSPEHFNVVNNLFLLKNKVWTTSSTTSSSTTVTSTTVTSTTETSSSTTSSTISSTTFTATSTTTVTNTSTTGTDTSTTGTDTSTTGTDTSTTVTETSTTATNTSNTETYTTTSGTTGTNTTIIRKSSKSNRQMKPGHISLIVIFPILLVIILVVFMYKNSMLLRKKETPIVNSTMGFSNPTYMSQLQSQVDSNYQDAVYVNNNDYIEVGDDDVFTETETDSEEDE